MPTRFYDVIVLGRETAAIAAAAMLARRGFRILWSGDGPAVETYTLAGMKLPVEPFVMNGVERPSVMRVGDELNLTQILRRRLPPHKPAFQVVLPRARVDVGDAQMLSLELDREFRDVRREVDGYLRAVQDIDGHMDDLLALPVTFPPQGFWERREVSRLAPALRRQGDPLATLPEAHPFRHFAEAPAAFAADADLESLTPALRARAYSNWRHGTFRVPGGRAGLAELFLEKSSGHSAELQPSLRADRLDIRRGRVVGLFPEGKNEALGCEFLVAGVRPERLLELMGDGRPARRFAEAMKAVRVAARRFAVNFVMPDHVLPEGMSTLVVEIPTKKDAAPLLLTASEPGDHGRVVLTAATLVPASNGATLTHERDMVRARVTKVVPFLDMHVLLCHSPHDGLPPTGPLAEGVEPPPAFDMSPVYRTADAHSGMAGLPYKTGLKNAFYAGRATLPGLGVEGEMEAAWGVSRIISRKRKAPDPFRKRSLLAPH